MSIKFNIVKRGRPGDSEAPKKYYPSIQSTGRVSVRKLAERASHISTLSTPDMMAAIEALLTIATSWSWAISVTSGCGSVQIQTFPAT